MTEFLSDGSTALHREFLRQLKLKYSILEKSIKGLKNRNINDIARQKLNRKDKEDALTLLGEIKAHEIFFASFGKNTYVPCPCVRQRFGSEAALMNELYKCARDLRCGYAAVCLSRREINVVGAEEGRTLYDFGEPVLVVDVCEHAYFTDYGFDKEAYLYRAIPYLDFTKVSDCMENGCK